MSTTTKTRAKGKGRGKIKLKPKPKPKPRVYANQYPARFPLAIRGRVEAAIFTCPRERCGTLIRFRARTQTAYRCPTCSTTFYVGLRVMIRRSHGGRVGIPPDSLLPKWRRYGPESLKSGDSDAIDPLASGTRGPKSQATTARPDAINAVVLVPVRPETIAEGSTESMPIVELERWEPGEPLHHVAEVEIEDGDNDTFKPELDESEPE